ncbi:MAG: hypothetical protein R3323_05895 [Wenzhouxiangellaceae bacterium]|nr:hypothetical protein [Wenzhouxiangellaceae bacterium]
MFVLLTTLAVLAALAFLAVPLLRSPSEAAAIRRRLRALDALEGDLDDAELDARRTKLRAELVEAGGDGRPWPLVAALLLAVPLAVAILYGMIGTPEGLEPAEGRAAEVREVLGELAERVRREPEDVEAWSRLGMAWKGLREWPSAEAAWRRVLFLEPGNDLARIELAETLLFASGRPELPPESARLLAQVLAEDPDNQRALWLTGLAAFQEQRWEGAVAAWSRLVEVLPPGEVREQVRGQLSDARRRLDPDAAAAPDPAQAPPADAGGPVIEVTVDVAPELRERVGANRTLFVFARASAGPPLPLAVRRLPATGFPVSVELRESDAMADGLTLSRFDTVDVVARVSATGDAVARPGDVQGTVQGIDTGSGERIRIVIDELVE